MLQSKLSTQRPGAPTSSATACRSHGRRDAGARGRERIESDHFVGLRSHFGFDAFFREPGSPGAHEKDGVEGETYGDDGDDLTLVGDGLSRRIVSAKRTPTRSSRCSPRRRGWRLWPRRCWSTTSGGRPSRWRRKPSRSGPARTSALTRSASRSGPVLLGGVHGGGAGAGHAPWPQACPSIHLLIRVGAGAGQGAAVAAAAGPGGRGRSR